MKKALSILMALGLLVALAACGNTNSGSAGTGDPIKIGGLAPLTGEVAQYGIAASNGAKLAVGEINAAGGVLGKQIEFILEDEKGDETEAVNAYNKLVQQDGVVAIWGDITTGPTIAVAQRAVQDNMPMMTPTGTGADITSFGESVFRTCFTDPDQGALMANYAQEKLEAKNVAVLYDTGSDYSVGIAEAFRDTAEKLGMEVIAYEGYQSKSSDFNSQLTKIKQGEPDVIMVPAYYEDVAKIVVQARSLGMDVPFLGSDGWDGVLNQIDKSNAADLDNCYYVSQYSAENPSPELEKFMKDYRKAYGVEESMFAVLGYEAMHMIVQAIKDADSVESDAIIAAIKAIEFQGLTGMVSFPNNNDPMRDAFIVTFEKGEQKILGKYNYS